ncbi:benzoate/H(+) symporter BenE family transporter [Peribacillus frigoritolerans]|nr:benzoate/H(+) symporter BenE family transporter [Peribacillus frigoritolerans]
MQLKKGSENKKGLLSHLNVRTVSAGTLAAVFGCTGPSLIIINGSIKWRINSNTSDFLVICHIFFGGILGILISVRNKQPIAGAYSIPGAVLVVGSLSNYSLNEAAGAYLAAGLIVFMLGIAGVIGKVMDWIPVPIVMSMVVGTMISFGTEMIASLEKSTNNCRFIHPRVSSLIPLYKKNFHLF